MVSSRQKKISTTQVRGAFARSRRLRDTLMLGPKCATVKCEKIGRLHPQRRNVRSVQDAVYP